MPKGFWITANEVPLYIQEIIFTKLQVAPAPYRYALRGTPGGGSTTYGSALVATDKLKAWAEKQGAEVIIVSDSFYKTKKLADARITIEITDPVSKALDELIEKFRGNKYYSPKDRDDWLRYREKVGI